MALRVPMPPLPKKKSQNSLRPSNTYRLYPGPPKPKLPSKQPPKKNTSTPQPLRTKHVNAAQEYDRQLRVRRRIYDLSGMKPEQKCKTWPKVQTKDTQDQPLDPFLSTLNDLLQRVPSIRLTVIRYTRIAQATSDPAHIAVRTEFKNRVTKLRCKNLQNILSGKHGITVNPSQLLKCPNLTYNFATIATNAFKLEEFEIEKANFYQTMWKNPQFTHFICN